MRLAHPHLLWLLLLVPIAVLAYGIAFAARRRALRRLGNPVLIARMSAATSVPRKVVRAALLCLAVGLMGMALARPQAGGRAHLEKQRGIDIIVALDFSKSMLAKDIYPSRLERAKRELERLMDRLSGDRVGLVAFAGETLTYPPTTDYDAVKLFWRDLSPSDMPVGGTAIGRALMSGIDMLSRLRQSGGATRDQVILLLTDGEDTESEPLEAADQAAKLAIKIFAVGIGSRSGELVPEIGENDQAAGYIKDKDGKYVTSRLDEDILSKIAAKTGGGYLRADAQHFGVEAIEAALAGLKRTESDTRLVKQYDEIFEYLLLPALLLLLIEICMGERRRERKKAEKQGGKQGSKIDGAQTAVVLMFLLPFVPFLGAWNPIERNNRAVESGNASMKSGKAEDALADYDKAVAELPSDAGAHFNRGNALFALSRFEEASAEFLRATQANEPGLKASAFYNLANSYFKNDKNSEAIAAYRHALALDPSNGRAKWNLELALQKKKEEDKKKEDDKNKDDKKDQDKKDDKKDQDKKDQDKKDDKKDQDKKDDKKDQDKKDDKKDQDKKDDKKDQDKKDDKKDQDKKDQQQQQQQQQDKTDQAPPPAKDDKAPEMREIDAVLDNLEHSPKDLEKMRARLRAVRRAPPAKDW
jgi:tetratricopeptide (TPR) repeat protein